MQQPPSQSDPAGDAGPEPAAMGDRRRHGPVLLFFLGLAALFYAPILLGLRTFPDGDFTHHFLPFSLFQQAELLAGRLPIWNPFTYAGHPFLADIQSGVFYPLNNLVLWPTLWLADPGARLYLLQVEAILQVALAGFFVYLLVDALTERPWAGVVAGAVFALSGYLTGYPPVQLAVLRSAIWLPLLLWLLLRAAQRPHRPGWWLGAALAQATALTGGHPQTLLHAGYVTGAWLLLLGWGVARRQGTVLRFAAGLLLFALLAVGLGAAQWLPSLEFSRLSVRAAVDYAFVSGGFPIQDTWQLLLPGLFTEYAPLYVGAAGLALAVLGAGVRPALSPLPGRSIPIFFGMTALFALLVSYGDNGFLYPLIYRLLPGWDLFRGQERAAYLVALSLSVLAGQGAAALPTLSPLARRRWAMTLGAAGTAGIYAVGLLWQLPGRTVLGNWGFLAVATISLVLLMAMALLIWWPGWNLRRIQLLLVVVVVNLVWANVGTNLAPFGPARKSLAAPEVNALVEAVAARAQANLGLSGRVYNEFRIYEDYGMRHGVEDVWGASPLRLARYAQLFEQFPLDRMWRLTGVEHLLTWRGELFEPSTVVGQFPQSSDTTYLHRLDELNPRAWVTPGVQVVDDAQALALLADHQFDLEAIGLLAPDDTRAPAGTERTLAQGPATPVSISLARPAPARLQVTVASGGGLLILSENWMPGWQVRDARCAGGACPAPAADAPLPLLTPVRADLSFVGVALPPGSVSFELRYAPQSVRLGLWISGISLLVMLLLAGWTWWAGRRPNLGKDATAP